MNNVETCDLGWYDGAMKYWWCINNGFLYLSLNATCRQLAVVQLFAKGIAKRNPLSQRDMDADMQVYWKWKGEISNTKKCSRVLRIWTFIM